MDANPECIDCGQIMIKRRSTKRKDVRIETYECLTCGATEKRRVKAMDVTSGADEKPMHEGARWSADFRAYLAAYRREHKSSSPLASWGAWYQGVSPRFMLKRNDLTTVYAGDDRAALVEALYASIDAGTLEPLQKFAVYAPEPPKKKRGAASKSTQKVDAATDAARVIDAAFAAAGEAADDIENSTAVTEKDGQIGHVAATRLSEKPTIGAEMCGGAGVTDNFVAPIAVVAAAATMDASADRGIIRDAGVGTENPLHEPETAQSGETDPEPIDDIERLKVGDRVRVDGRPDLGWGISAIQNGKILITRLAPDGQGAEGVWMNPRSVVKLPAPDLPVAPVSAHDFKAGDRVKVRGSAQIGTVINVLGERVYVRRRFPGAKSDINDWVMHWQLERVDDLPVAPVKPTPPPSMGRAVEDRTRSKALYNRDMDKRQTRWCTCVECQKDFRAGRGDAKTCSVRCRKAYSRRNEVVNNHINEAENAIKRLLELAKKYPDQRTRIEKALTDAQYRAERGRGDVRRLLSSYDVN